ncbi:helix-turn-helix transcriptional regulator [Lentzea albida]|uniref:Regulatory protein, luxR family n=1 Tax=Lentzea albida TaxID=65499 RepID=A0A1H9X3U4_9PSEU|nr:LuxR family transcriptional regulator [Lentzea albida]SES40784.1 regulatory protein, luxR family [Lentzea albida]
MEADASRSRNPDSRTILVGRDAEVKRIEEALDSAQASTPSALLFEGAIGIGKTSLLEAACSMARRRGFVIARATASPMEREMPFAVAQQLFEHLPRESSAGPGDEAAPHGHAVIAGEVAGDVNDFEEVHVHQAIRDLYRITTGLAQHAPLCLVIDDVQWTDVPSMRWLNYLVHRVVRLPITILLGRTSGIRPTDPILLAELEIYTERLRLGTLTAPDIASLTEQVLGRAPHEKFTDAVMRATHGYPMVCTHILSLMRERSVVPDEPAADDLPTPEPEELGQSVLARLNRQSRELVDVAKAIAVVAPPHLQLLAAVTGMSGGAVAEQVRQLEGMGVLAPPGKLTFAHSVLKDAIEKAVGFGDREELHAEAARFLHQTRAPSLLIARHVVRTSSRLGTWAVDALRSAAEALITEGDPRSGAKFLNRALEEDVSAAQRRDLLLRLGFAETYFDPRMAVVHLEEGMSELDDPERTLAVVCRLAQVLYLDGAYDKATEVLHRTIDEIGPKIPAAVDMLRLLNRLTAPSGDPAAGQVDLTRFDEREWRRRDPRGRRLAALIAEDAGNRGTDLTLCREAAAAAMQNGAAAMLQHPQRLLGVLNAFIRTDEPHLVMRYCNEILLEAHREGLSLIELLGHTVRSRAHYHCGSFTEAVADARLALSAARKAELPPGHFGSVYAVEALMRAQLELGAVDDAEETLLLLGRTRSLPQTWHHTALLHARGALRLARGDAGGALADQLDCGERLVSWGMGNPAVRPWRSYAALAWLRLGQHREALDLALEELTLAREWGAPTVVARALLTVGVVTGGVAAAPRLAEAESLLRNSPARMLHAQVLLELAASRWEKGQRDEARQHLAEARTLGEQCGVVVEPGERLAGSGLEDARGVPAPPPAVTAKAVPAGSSSTALLTPHEYRVAGLVLEGNSNDEIAHKLNVSRRTIEFHLTSIYRKLGVRRRTQLSSALAGFASHM